MTAIRSKWEEMSWLRRVLLLIMLAEIAVFAVVTAVTVGRWGLEYQGELLYPRAEGDVTWYEGKVDGENAAFSIAPDGTVEYRWGEYVYGPYQVAEDPTAVPEDTRGGQGVEIRLGGEVLFRGYRFSDLLFDEDGELFSEIRTYGHTSDGSIVGDGGREISQQEYHAPGISALIRVAWEPELTHKGSVGIYLATTLLALLNVVLILFPEAVFRLSLWGHVRNIDDAEPSEWYIFSQYVGWIALAIGCLILYVTAAGSIA